MHALQVPEQAPSQQTPSTQCAFVHWLSPPQALPLLFFAAQEPPEQYAFAPHAASFTHELRHELPLHMKLPQLCVPPATHVPDPLQSDALVCVEPLHDWATQTVPFAYFRHALAPSHMPSVPQVAVP